MYREVISPLLDPLPSEPTHVFVRDMLHFAEEHLRLLDIMDRTIFCGPRVNDPRLNVQLGRVLLDNPATVGAGWDKPGHAVYALYRAGFSLDMIGGATAWGQEGNPKNRKWKIIPGSRQAMIGPGVSLNWLGLNNKGVQAVMENIKRYKKLGLPTAVNVSINKEVDHEVADLAFIKALMVLYPEVNILELNPSSPNTARLRILQQKSHLIRIAEAVTQVRDFYGEPYKDIFLKCDPDQSDQTTYNMAQVCIDYGFTGMSVANTTTNPDIKAKHGEKWRHAPGGLAGDDPDYRFLTTRKVAFIRREVNNPNFMIIGLGGIKDTATGLEKLKAGANALAMVSSLRGEGLGIANNMNRGFLRQMDQDGVKNISEYVGIEAHLYQ